MKAHQRIIREQRAADDADSDMFGRWWQGIDVDIRRADVRLVSYETAKAIIEKYEWLECMPAVVWYSYGIFFDGCCAGVVCYGPEYSENLGKVARETGRKCADWSKYGFEGKLILLSRGACTHWAHPHSASKLIRESMSLLPPQYEVVTATCDPAAGEIGTIYQACGFEYVGSMRDNRDTVKSRFMDRDAWLIDGKIVGSRSIRQRCGSTKAGDIAKVFPNAKKIKQHSKHRYFAFRGPPATKKRNRRAIEHLFQKYPKRAGQVSSRDTAGAPSKAGGSSPVPLQNGE
jgi:hypothetical protein